MKRWIILLFLSAACLGWAGASKEGGGSATRGKFLAGRGVIVPPEEIHIETYIAQINYRYPLPETTIGISLYTGHRQLSTAGQEEVLQIGIQARDLPFEGLQPLNLSFVIDKSGSMADRYKMNYVKKSFDVFFDNVRQKDFVSLIVFDDHAEVLFPSTQMDSYDTRERFRSIVHSITPEGGTNLVAGLRIGYEQVLSNFRSEYTNRVLFLTDGVGESTGIMDLADSYRQMDINVSTIGMGDSVDLELISELARRGGGSSRFISDTQEMEKIFGSELDRMAVSAARDLEMKLEFLQPVEIVGTWGYDNRIQGEVHRSGPFDISVEYVDTTDPVSGFSSGMVLRSGTTLRFAKNLKRIGEIYYSRTDEVEPEFIDKIRTCLDLSLDMRKELVNAKLRLDDVGFDDEIEILGNYIRILGQDLDLPGEELMRITGDIEMLPSAPDRPLDKHLQNLFREITLEMEGKGEGAIAVAGFMMKKEGQPELITMLNEMSLLELSKLTQLRVVERDRIDLVLKEKELALADLVDTTKAISVGKVLAAQYILTGTLIEMTNSVVIFGRVVNVETTEIESAAQVIVPKNREVRALL